VSSSVHRDGQGIDRIVLGVRPEKLHEHDLSTKVESCNEAIISSGDGEAYTFAVQYLRLWNGASYIVHGYPLRCPYQPLPAFKRDRGFGVSCGICHEHVSGDQPLFP